MTANTFASTRARRRSDTGDKRVPGSSFVPVAAETADWLADRVMTFELCGLSRPGVADRLRQQARSYRANSGSLATNLG
jgi:hypothetical protein